MGGTVRRRIIVTSEFKANVTGTKQVNALAKAQAGVTKETKKAISTFGTVRSGLTRLRIVYFNLAVLLGTVALITRALIKPIIDLETEMVSVRKTTGATAEEIENLKEGLLDLSRTTPQSAIELAKIATVAGQLGIRGKQDILEFTRVVDMMAVATVLTSEEAALALAKLTTAFKIPITQVEGLGSAINELSNTTAANSKEIVSAMVRMASAANQLGITIDVAAAISASLIEMGMRSERAGTRMKSAFTKMAVNTDKVARLFRKMGLNVDATSDTIKQRLDEDANQVLFDFLLALSKVESGTERLQLSTQILGQVGATAVNSLVTNMINLRRSVLLASDEFQNAQSLQQEFNLALESTANQWSILWGNLRADITETGDASVSAFGKMLQMINLNTSGARLLNEVLKELEIRTVLGPTFLFTEEDRKVSEDTIETLRKLRLARELPTKFLIGSPEDVKRLEQIVALAQKELEATGDIGKARSIIIDFLAEEREKQIELTPEEEIKKIEELTKARVDFFNTFDKGIQEQIDANRRLTESEESLEKINSKQAQRIRELVIVRANQELGLGSLGEKTKDLQEKQTQYNDRLRILQEDYALGTLILEQYNQKVKDLKDEYPELIRLTEVQALAINKLKEETVSAGKALGDLISKFGVKKADIKFGKLEEFRRKEAAGEETAILFGGATVKKSTPLDDFIARPNQPIASFSPDDTIIGTKDPTSIINKKVGPITINVNGAQSPFNTAQEISRQIKSLA